MSQDATGSELSDLRALILTAFEAAHAKELPTWRQMSTAVLKNRLLQATGGQFSEREWGFRNMVELVQAFPDLLEVSDQRPYLVQLRAEEDDVSEAAIQVMGERARVRADLWRGIMDYSAGHPWAWVNEAVVEGHTGSPDLLPTINADVLAGWRHDFATNLPAEVPLTERDRAQVDTWQRDGLTTYALPGHLRGIWNQRLKVNVVDRLTQWFADRGESPPADVLLASPTQRSRSHVSVRGTSRVRSLVEACVEAMTEAELATLSIPADVILRVSGTRPELLR